MNTPPPAAAPNDLSSSHRVRAVALVVASLPVPFVVPIAGVMSLITTFLFYFSGGQYRMGPIVSAGPPIALAAALVAGTITAWRTARFRPAFTMMLTTTATAWVLLVVAEWLLSFSFAFGVVSAQRPSQLPGLILPFCFLGALGMLVASGFLGLKDGKRVDLDSPRGPLRTYLYIASLAGLILVLVGLASLVNVGLAIAGGNESMYGGPPPVMTCLPGAPVGCIDRPPASAPDAESRRDEDLIRGVSFTGLGLLFWAAHFVPRRGLSGTEEPGSPIRRGYLLAGTVLFGLLAMVLLPSGIYEARSGIILPGPPSTFRPGLSDSLAGGIAALPIWLSFLWRMIRDVIRGGARAA